MSHRLLVLALLVSACGAPRPAPTVATTSSSEPSVSSPRAINDELSVQTIAPDTWVATHKPFFGANVLVAKMKDGAVVIASSPFETEASTALVRWIRAELSPTRIVAINTHFHFDGTGGNEAYRALGVETYASDHTQRLLAEKGAALKAGSVEDFTDPDRRRRVSSMKVTPAEHTFDEREGLIFHFSGEEVRVIYPGPGHSPDNLVVFFPARSVLFGGCMIKGSRSIGFIGHADLERWEGSVERARSLGAKVIVPGHGAVGTEALFDLTAVVVHDARSK